MGVYLSSPITDKISTDEKCIKFTYGASSMQGWRMSQEDAHNCVPEFEEDTSLFAVYDGHGGAEVAQYCAIHLPDYIKQTAAYKDGRLDVGLQDAFLRFDATLTQPHVIRELKTLAGVEEEAEEKKAGVFPASQNERDLLLAEANMPLEEVLAQYDDIPGLPHKSLNIKNAKHQFQSPMIRPKSSHSEKAGGDTWSTSTVTSEADSTKSSQEEDTKSARVSLDSKLANGHADNDNNMNIEKEISQTFPSVSIVVQDEEGNDVTDCQSSKAEYQNLTDCNSLPTSTTGPLDRDTADISKSTPETSPASNLPSSTTLNDGASSSTDAGLSTSSEADKAKHTDLISSNVTDEIDPSKTDSSKNPGTSEILEANSSSSVKPDLASSSQLVSDSSVQSDPSSGSSTQPEPSSGSSIQPEPSSGSSTQPEPSTGPSTQPEPSTGPSSQPGSSSGSSTRPEPSTGPSTQPGSSSGSSNPPGSSSASSSQPEQSSGSSSQPGSSSGPSRDHQDCGSSVEVPVAGSSSGLSMLVMEDDSDDDSEDYEGSSEEDASEEEEEDSDDGELEEIDGALSKDSMLVKQEEEPGSDSGCTAVVAIIKGRQLVVANAGDSRCVLCRDGKAVDLSFDHKPEDFLEQQRIEMAGGKVTMDGRVNGGLNLSRALGDHCYKKNDGLPAKDQMITAYPDIQSTTLGREDEFIVLACDGIWNYLNSQEVVDFVRKKLSNSEYSETPSKICEEMFNHCLAPNTMGDGTGCDNMTCIVILLAEKFRASGPFVAELEPVKSGPLKRELSEVDTSDQDSGQVEKKLKLSTEEDEKMEVSNSTDFNHEESKEKTNSNEGNEMEVKAERSQTESIVSDNNDSKSDQT